RHAGHSDRGRLSARGLAPRRRGARARGRQNRRARHARRATALERALSSARRRRRRRQSEAGRAVSATGEGTGAGGRIALLRTLLGPYRGRVIGAMSATVLATAAKLAPPYLAGLVVDDVIQTGST